MLRKVLLKVKNDDSNNFVESIPDCHGLSLPSEQIEVDFTSISVTDLKQKVSNNISFLSPELDKGLEKVFSLMVIKREYFETLLAETDKFPAYRMYIGSKSKMHDQEDFTIIIVPVDGDQNDVILDNTLVIECQKPPGCPADTGAKLIEDPIIPFMFRQTI